MKTFFSRALPLATVTGLFLSTRLLAVGPVVHNLPEPTGPEAEITIAQSFAPFGNRPDTDKTSEDGSVAFRDLNGVIIWVDSQGVSTVLPNSALAKTLYVSNSECVLWTDRYGSSYNLRESSSTVVVYRRNDDGTVAASAPITIPGTLLETAAISPSTFGFTLVACEARASNPENDSLQRFISGTDAQGNPQYQVRDVDQWDVREISAFRLTYDGQLQTLALDRYYVPKNALNIEGVRLMGAGADGALLLSMTIARDFYDDVEDDDPGVFKSQINGFWITWQSGLEKISPLPLFAAENPPTEAVSVSNSRLLLETAAVDTDEFPTGNYRIQDIRQSNSGAVTLAETYDLPLGQRTLPLSAYTRPGLTPFLYTANSARTSLSLFKIDDGLIPLGTEISLGTSVISRGAAFVRNPLDASLLIKADGTAGVLWFPTTLDANNQPTALLPPVRLPSSSLGRPMFVSALEAVVWMNAGAPPDLANGGVVPLANIVHFSGTAGNLVSTTMTGNEPSPVVTTPILGRYVASTPSLSLEPENEGWFISTFEKTAPRTALLRAYRLRSANTLDSDGDGLLDIEEKEKKPGNDGGLVNGGDADPKNPDTDWDGVTDGQEIYPFYLISGSFTYEQARQEAIRKGGFLAVLDTEAEKNALKRLLGNLPFGSRYWLGGGDFDGPNPPNAPGSREGKYRWMDQNGVFFDGNGNATTTVANDYTANPPVISNPPWAWAPGQPTNTGDSDGLVLRSDYTWEMAPASRSYGYIFQFRPSNPLEKDSDGDGLLDNEEVQYGTNPSLIDTDADGVSDLLNGVSDLLEVRGYSWDPDSGMFVLNQESGFISDPLKVDSDDDGISDGDEVRYYLTNPVLSDTDGDGLTDKEEVDVDVGTNPLNEDTDGDGFTDFDEVNAVPPTNPNDPNSRPAPGQLRPRNPNMHNQVQFVRQQPDVSIPAAFSPFGNRSDYNRFGDDGSAMILDVNGVLLWEDATGVVRILPNSEFAIPLVVSGTESIVWTNAFDPARILADPEDAEAKIKVAVYRVNPATGQVDTPTPLEIEGNDILPTAPITTTTQAYTLVTMQHLGSGEDGGSIAYIYRMTFAGNAQLLSRILIPNQDETLTALQNVRVLGHGSDGSVVFSVDARAWFLDNRPVQDLLDGVTDSRYRRILWANGSHPTPSGVVVDLSGNTLRENLGQGNLPPVVLYTSASRVVYQTATDLPTKDARRNTITAALTSDALMPPPAGFGADEQFLKISTQTREGQTRWLYTSASNGALVKAYRLINTGLQLVYSAQVPAGAQVDAAATVTKINPLDGSALISPDSANMVWLFNNQRPTELPNAVIIPNSLNARAVYVQRNELVVWNNARDTLNNIGGMRNVDLRHYEQKDGRIVNPTNGFTNLSPKVNGRYVLDTPPFTPDFPFWRVTTVEKSTPTSARFRSYLLVSYNSLDTDADGIPDLLEVTAGTDPFNNDSDADDLTDGDEFYPLNIINGSFTWEEAKADAASRGGRLAVVPNQDDYTALQRRFNGLNAFDLWLGATDQVTEGQWKWLTGANLDVVVDVVEWRKPSTILSWAAYYGDISTIRVPWAVSKPDNFNNADGLVLRSDLSFEDRPITERRGYLIEYPRTNPNKADSDGDGMRDGDEINNGTDPGFQNPFAGVPSITAGDNGSGSSFVPFSDARVATTYEGLIFDPVQGHVFHQKLSVSTKGGFSSSIRGVTSTLRSSFKGGFNPAGYYLGAAPSGLANIVSIELQLFMEAPGQWIVRGRAQKTTGGWLGIELRPAKYGKNRAYPLPGRLTMALPNRNAGLAGPRGEGAIVGAISSAGGVSLQMHLPDGGRASYSGPILTGPVASDDLLTIYGLFSSRNRSSALLGPVDMAANNVNNDFEGYARFYSAASANGGQFTGGFDQLRTINGSRYVAPPKGFFPVDSITAGAFNTLFKMEGGDFGGISKVATWNVTNNIVIPASPTDSGSVKFDSKTGLVTFSYTRTDAERQLLNSVASGFAVTHQKTATIPGYYTSAFSNGELNVTPNDGTIPELTLISPMRRTVDKSGEIYEVQVQTPGDWEIVVPDGVTWLKAEIISGGATSTTPGTDTGTTTTSTTQGNGNGVVRITVNANVTYRVREASVEIAGNEHEIKQKN